MKYYTGVGSRETPREILSLMYKIGSKLAVEGYTLRSGGAAGADSAFQLGCSMHDGDKEIYLPWNGFSEMWEDHESGIYVPIKDRTYFMAEEIVSEVHPAWDKLTRGPRGLHTRNVYQVLGQDLNTPSNFLLCYSKPSGNSVSGGTRTAWEVAKKFGVPCFNLFHKETADRIKKFIKEDYENDYFT